MLISYSPEHAGRWKVPMHNLWQPIIDTAIGLALANYLLAALSKKREWGQAHERTFFQIVALTAFVVVLFSKGYR